MLLSEEEHLLHQSLPRESFNIIQKWSICNHNKIVQNVVNSKSAQFFWYPYRYTYFN